VANVKMVARCAHHIREVINAEESHKIAARNIYKPALVINWALFRFILPPHQRDNPRPANRIYFPMQGIPRLYLVWYKCLLEVRDSLLATLIHSTRETKFDMQQKIFLFNFSGPKISSNYFQIKLSTEILTHSKNICSDKNIITNLQHFAHLKKHSN